jgi:FMN phosphatase YigB (HAD superfamily)
MEKHIIDIGKLTIKKKKILKYLHNYNLIIFDLDNTVFPLFYYDKIIFKKISQKINKQTNIQNKKLFNYLIYNKFRKNKERLFYFFLKEFNLNKVVSEKKLVNYYQNFKFIKNFKPPSLINIIKDLKKNRKKLMLITEGNKRRQMNKIKSLGIENLFDYKIILDGKYNRKYKPSMKGVTKYIKLFKMYKSIYLGDSQKDKKLSNKLNIKFYKFDISTFLNI